MVLASGCEVSVLEERHIPDTVIEPCECGCHDEVEHD